MNDDITIDRDTLRVHWCDVVALFDSVGWTGRTAEERAAIFAASAVVRFAFDCDGHMIGACRAITDGHVFALIVDLVVAPDRQREGIGRRLLDEVRDALRHVRNVHLFATPGNEAFYEASGMERQPLVAFSDRNAPISRRA